MSRGLGRVQRLILDRLRECNRWVGIPRLANMVYHPERFEYQGVFYWNDGPDSWDMSHSERVSIHRAVRSLERRGLVVTEVKRTLAFEFGQAARYKQVKLSVDDCADLA